ncbi:MAG: glycosyltransferase family 1 protein [Burkholderiaceae bacterium]|nr:glycosyltransferase family 1 protein [Burkholderiaceae bacterium]
MRFAVLTYGTEGDARPLAFLCRALVDAGHEALLLADSATLGSARSLQVPCVPLSGDIRGVLDQEGAIAGVVREGGSLSRAAKALAGIVNRNTVAWTATTKEAASDCDALLVGGLAGFIGLSVAEHLGVPAIGLGMIPITPTREFASPFLPPGRVPSFLNRSSQALVNRLLWSAFRRETNHARRQVLGLPPRRTLWQGHPMLYGISPQLLPPPGDWPSNAHVCGQWIRPLRDWAAPRELQAFLDAGEPPFYVGFGSMQGFDPRSMRERVIEAVAGRRALLNPGWSGMDVGSLPSNFHVVVEAPHDWLFPRVAAVVHHGGSGTSHSACRAGVPSVVLPFAGDQAFWAERLVRIGVSPRRLDASAGPGELRRALDEAADAQIRARAADVGRRMREEDGLANAVALVESLVGGTAG